MSQRSVSSLRAKASQGWTQDPFPNCCGNCRWYDREVFQSSNGKIYYSNRECTCGHFQTRTTATCNLFDKK